MTTKFMGLLGAAALTVTTSMAHAQGAGQGPALDRAALLTLADDMSNQRALDMPTLHIVTIWGGQIHEIEAVGITVGYNTPTGWE